MKTLKNILRKIYHFVFRYDPVKKHIERGLVVGKNFCMLEEVKIDYSHTWHIEIGDDVTITAMTGVHRSINKAGVYSSAWPAQENRVWHRYLALLGRLVRERSHTSSSED